MKKIFSFVVVAFAAIALNAAEAVFDFTNPASLNITPNKDGDSETHLKGTSYTVGDVTIAFPEEISGNGFKLWTNTNGTYDLRIYQPNSFSVTSSGANISKVLFSFSTKGGLAPATGEIDATGAWLGDAASISFGVPKNGSASKIKSITVYTGEAPIVTIDTLNVSDMIDQIDAAPKQNLSKQACVIGRVTGIDKSGASQYGNISVWLADINNTTDTIEAFRMKSLNGEKYKDVEDIQFGMGDTIVVYSNSWLLYTEEGKKSQYEAAEGCYLAKVIGEGNPDPIVINQITVEEAIEIGDGLAAGGKTTEKYDVRGYVVSISSTRGLEKIYLSDEPEAFGTFQAYQCEIPEGANVEKGSFVSVVGYIEKFQFEGSTDYTIEISKGKLTVVDPTALPNVIAEKVSCKKMMINGQMYIKNGKKLYNVLGQAL